VKRASTEHPNAAQTGAQLRLQRLTKSYGPTAPPAVDDIDLEIPAGEFVTLLGPSGSGKTTTLNLIAGFLEPTSGSIELNGSDISTVPAHRRNFGMVFQSYALFPHMTVEQNVGFPLKQRGVPKEARREQIRAALELVDLIHLGSRVPSALSGGQQQRVALARAVVYSPPLLLLDEPLGALDRRLRQTLQGEIKRIHRELGLTFLFVTHDQDEAMSLSDRIAVFNEGKIEQVGAPAEVYNNPRTLFVAGFVGESNSFSGSCQGGVYRAAGCSLRVHDSQRPDSNDALVVRPEKLNIALADTEVPTGANVIPATVVDYSYLGTMRRVDLDYGDGSHGVSVLSGSVSDSLERGHRVWAHWWPKDQVFVRAQHSDAPALAEVS
jgi:putative spermidine/putrescine transport system ATP-binding protein